MSLTLTQSVVEKILDGRHNSFREALGDGTYTSGSPLALAANTEVVIPNDKADYESNTKPDYLSGSANGWSVNKCAFPDELDNPTYMNDVTVTFAPGTANAGVAVLRIRIDESGTQAMGADPIIRTYVGDFKSVATTFSRLTTWYLGEDVGGDAKNDGVYFTLETTIAGGVYGIFMNIYRT